MHEPQEKQDWIARPIMEDKVQVTLVFAYQIRYGTQVDWQKWKTNEAGTREKTWFRKTRQLYQKPATWIVGNGWNA